MESDINENSIENLSPYQKPFVFPSNTIFQFVLLILSVIGATLFLHYLIYFQNSDNRLREIDAMFRLKLAETARQKGLDPSESPILNKESIDSLVSQIGLEKLKWTAGGIGLLFITASLFFYSHPRIKIWRDGLQPLTVEDATPELIQFLKDLSKNADLPSPPIFLWNPMNRVSTAVAFGYRGKYYISLSGGLVTQFFTDRQGFKAILLHELAHIYNRDIDKTYFTIAIWRAFLLIGLLPFLIFMLPGFTAPSWIMARILIQVFALTLLIYLTRNAVLRNREIYADLRAANWEGKNGVIKQLLQRIPHQNGPYWKYLLQVHPFPVQRYKALEDQQPLFKLGLWESFGVGIAIPFALSNFIGIVTAANMAGFNLSIYVASLSIGLVAVPSSIIIVLGLWRMTFLRFMQGKSIWKRTILVATAFSFGLTIGRYLSLSSDKNVETLAHSKDPIAVLIGADTFYSPSILDSLTVEFTSLMLEIVCLTLFFRWIATCANAWLTVTNKTLELRYSAVAGVITGTLVFTNLLTVLFFSRDNAFIHLSQIAESKEEAVAGFLPLLGSGEVWSQIPLVFSFPAVFSLWAFPLGAYFYTRYRSNSKLPTENVDKNQLQPVNDLEIFRPIMALSVGAVVGILSWFLLMLIHVGAFSAFKQGQISEEDLSNLLYGEMFLASIIQGVAAVVVGFLTQRMGTIHGLCAAFSSALVVGIGIIIFNLLFRGTTEPESIQYILFGVVLNGVIISIVLSFISSFISRQIRKRYSFTFSLEPIKQRYYNFLDKFKAYFIKLSKAPPKIGFGTAFFLIFALYQCGRLVNTYTEQRQLEERYKRYLEISDPKKNYEQGLLEFQAGNYQNALKSFEIVIQRCGLFTPKPCVDPDIYKVTLKLGFVYVKLGMYDKATLNIREGLYLAEGLTNAELSEAHYYLGNAYMNLRQLDEAVKEFNQSIQLSPDYDEAIYQLGTVYVTMNKRNLAAEQLKILTTHNSNFAEPLKNLLDKKNIPPKNK